MNLSIISSSLRVSIISSSLRVSLASLFSVAAIAAVGCAAPSADDNNRSDFDVTIPAAEVATAQSLTLVQPQPQVTPVQGIQIVAPQCRAVLVSSTPTDNGGSFYPSCSLAANPHVAQRRIAGYIEGRVTDLRDQADPSHFVCKPSLVKGGLPVCSMTPDRVIEKLCSETRVYDCPCGVETVMVDGAPAGYCRTMPR